VSEDADRYRSLSIGLQKLTLTEQIPIQLKTLLNKFHPIKRFVYKRCALGEVNGREAIVAEIAPRANSRPRCSCCSKPGPGYDTAPSARLFRFVPLWGIDVYLRYAMRRVECPQCGVTVEAVPWAEGKQTCTHAMRLFLADWARYLSWSDVARRFATSWDIVCRAVSSVVSFGLKNRNTAGVGALGIDEVAYRKGHHYMTLVYQIDGSCRRLLGVVEGRRVRSLLRFFHEFGRENCATVRVVCSDMWKPYLKVIARKLPQALNILDRFHIVKKLSEAVDNVRRSEAAQMRKDGYEPVLTGSRYCFLKRAANMTRNQKSKLRDLMQYNLKSVRAYLLKESFDAFWKYHNARWARWFLHKWCARAMRSRLEPMKKFVRTLRNHEELLMNYFIAGKRYNSGIVEGLNLRINLSMRKAYGFRSFDVMKVALFHQLGNLPEPESTHRFS